MRSRTSQITDADWRHYFEVNVLSGAGRLAYISRHAERNWGWIIFISSDRASSRRAMIHYGMTGTAQPRRLARLAGLTKGTKVTVNSSCPGRRVPEGIIDF